MKKQEIQHIFFDLDHTLWDFDRNSLLAYQRIFEERDISIGLTDFLEVYTPINLSYWKLYREQKIDSLSLRRQRLSDVFKKFNLQFSLKQIDTIADLYISYLPEYGYLIEGAVELLDYLAPKYQLHIITNGFRKVQREKLKTSQIATYFATVTDSDSVGVKKPNPLIFEHALQLAKAENTRSLMIGDNFEADIVGAEKVGMHTLLFNYHKEKVSEDYTQVSRLLTIKEYL